MKKVLSTAPVDIAEILETLIGMATNGREPPFRELAKAAGLDPGRDFIGASLRDLDFRDEDLRGFDFSQADLTGADFRRANITGVSFSGADLTGAIGLTAGADIFISYMSEDRAWAFWIGHQLNLLGHRPHIADWEISFGDNIIKWMDGLLQDVDYILCVVSGSYLKKPAASLDPIPALWDFSTGAPSVIPVFVEPCEAPIMLRSLKHLQLYGLTESDARARLEAFSALLMPRSTAFPRVTTSAPRLPSGPGPSSFPGGILPSVVDVPLVDDPAGATDPRKMQREEIETADGREAAVVVRQKAEGQIQLRVGVASSEETRWFRPGAGKTEWFQDFAAAPEMVVVPSGSFLMGSAEGEGNDDERPQRRVTIVRPFAVGRFAVAFQEWDAAYRQGGVKLNPDDWGWGRGRRPVINVSWHDAKAYVAWLAQQTGKDYRLLSEAEWEYCCRAGTNTSFWWGETISTSQANYNGNSFGGESEGEYRERTVPVDSFAPNPWGLYQVHGNVWEWCEDNWQEDYSGTPPVDGATWKGVYPGDRVLRGGAWNDDPEALRAAARRWIDPDDRILGFGFRVARML